MNLLHKVSLYLADIATAKISAQSTHTGYGDMAIFPKFAKNNENCWHDMWQYLQGIGGPYDANASSNRTPSMRKWVSTLSVICPR